MGVEENAEQDVDFTELCELMWDGVKEACQNPIEFLDDLRKHV